MTSPESIYLPLIRDDIRWSAKTAAWVSEYAGNILKYPDVPPEAAAKIVAAQEHLRMAQNELASALESTLPPVPADAGPVCVGERGES